MWNLIRLALCLAAGAAMAAEPVVVWKPPPPAVGGMISSVDPDTIRIGDGVRYATWRMDAWNATSPADANGTWKDSDGRSVRSVLIDVQVHCSDRTMLEAPPTFLYSDGSSQRPRPNSDAKWNVGNGATSSLIDFICGWSRK